MAKDKIIILGFLLLSGCFGLSGQNPGDRVKEIYDSQVGVREATGHNDGCQVERYLAVTGFKKGSAWCASFVAWVFEQAGIPTVKSAWSPSWFPDSKTIYTRGANMNKVPSQADVFGIYFHKYKRIAHVGFIDRWPSNSSYVVTVEGNTNDGLSREGDGVYRKRRLKSQIFKVSRWTN